MPTTLLLPQVVEAVGDRVLVIGAGGFFSGRGLVAALAYGAAGVAMERLLAVGREPGPRSRQVALRRDAGDRHRGHDEGRWRAARVVRTDLVEHLETQGWLRALPRALRSAYQFRQETGASVGSLLREGRAMKEGNELTWSQVVMAANAPVMTKAMLVEGRTDVGVLPTGQVVGLIDSLPPVADIVDGIMAEADAVLCGSAAAEYGSPAATAELTERLGRLSSPSCRVPSLPGRRGGAGSDPLVGHPEKVGDARDALALGAEGDDERATQVTARL